MKGFPKIFNADYWPPNMFKNEDDLVKNNEEDLTQKLRWPDTKNEDDQNLKNEDDLILQPTNEDDLTIKLKTIMPENQILTNQALHSPLYFVSPSLNTNSCPLMKSSQAGSLYSDFVAKKCV